MVDRRGLSVGLQRTIKASGYPRSPTPRQGLVRPPVLTAGESMDEGDSYRGLVDQTRNC